METNKKTVAVLVPTYRPGRKFSRLLQMLERQTYPVSQIVIMNTEESLWNARGYEGIPGLEVHHVRKKDFDHGGTRRQGMEYVKADACICMTDDAVPADRWMVERLVKALFPDMGAESVGGTDSGNAGGESTHGGVAGTVIAAAYARQLPDKQCRRVERYTRSFNYPEESRIKTKADLPQLGIKTYFCSNVCAAYNMEIYRSLGGFIEKTIFNEDMLYAAGAVQAGYGIVYVADARVIHSHNYGCIQQLRRNFDLAVSQAQHPEVFAGLPSEGEGIRMIKETARRLVREHRAYLLLELITVSGCKYLGYRLGKHYRLLPVWLVRRLTVNPAYWGWT